MKVLSRMLILLTAFAVCFSSCKKDDEEEESNALTQEQADEIISSATTTFNTTIDGMSSEPAISAINSFNGIFLSEKSFMKPYFKLAKPNFDVKELLPANLQRNNNSGILDMDFYLAILYLYQVVENEDGDILFGTYTIDAYGDLVSYEETPDDGITIVYPLESGTAAIAYTNISLTDPDDEGYAYLSTCNCEITVEDQIIYSAIYTNGSFYGYRLNVSMGSYSITTSYNTSGTESDGTSTSSTSIKFDNTTVYAESITKTKTPEDIDFVGDITIGGLVFKVRIFAQTEQIQTPNPALDEIATIELFNTSGEKVGHFEFEGNGMFFYYNDGVRIAPETLMPDLYNYCYQFFYNAFEE